MLVEARVKILIHPLNPVIRSLLGLRARVDEVRVVFVYSTLGTAFLGNDDECGIQACLEMERTQVSKLSL